ncbi:hypothetical protein M408DRAFT_76951 [Serendipita vermifera MAFF 305830]|uniref:Mitochondrial carrier n=1 Tax=Serendipita vermifera MAFF 305830 TaxID=933852 RepID=A0A0C2WBL3_SERVB|nr:hypothetical protein M408DRAFT_76951 [Serendipita vermifera MAFF 305830]
MTSKKPSPQEHQFVSLLSTQSLIAFIAGGTAGAASRTLVSPLERLKIIQQVQGASGGGATYNGVWNSLVRMWKEEGFRGYMRGNGVNCLRIVPYSAVQFTTYEFMKRVVVFQGFELNPFFRFGAGAIAGIVAVTSTYPLDIVRTRLSIASASFSRLDQNSAGSTGRLGSSASRGLHTSAGRNLATMAATASSSIPRSEPLGVMTMAMKIMREEGGPRALYRGLVPTALGVAPYNGFNFAAYETLKPIICPPGKQNSHRKWLTGALAGTISQTLTYPLDFLRRKSQLASAKGFKQYNGAIDAARHVFKSEGVRGFYRGMWPNLIKAMPATAAQFWVYELVKDYLIAEWKP